MLKRQDPPGEPDGIATLFARAKDETLDWVNAEVAYYKTIGVEKANAWKVPVILFGAALFLGHAALLVLVATLFVALAQVMNPALAGVVSVIILAGSAAILVKVALGKLKANGQ